MPNQSVQEFVANLRDFEETYRDTFTKKTSGVAEFWTLWTASLILLHLLRLDCKQALGG